MDQISAKDLYISAPQVQLTAKADIENLDIEFQEDAQEGRVFELTQTASLNTQNLRIDGILYNKGQIDLKDPWVLKTKAFLNSGVLKAAGNLTIESDTLFQTTGLIEAQKNLYISANVIRQVYSKEPKSKIAAQTLHMVANEDVLLQGNVSTNRLELTSLTGKLQNEAHIRAEQVFVTA